MSSRSPGSARRASPRSNGPPAADPQLLRLIRNHPHGLLVVGSDSGRIIHANAAARMLLCGDPKAEIEGSLLGIPVVKGQTTLVEAAPPTCRRLRMSVESVSWAGRQEQFITLREAQASDRGGGRRREAERGGPDRALLLLAHELRSPLSAMLGALHASRLDPTGQEGAMAFVEHQARRLGRLLEDLVEGEVSDGRSIPIRPVMIAAGRLVSMNAEAIRPLISGRGQHLRVTSPEEPILLAVDPTWIEQALLHLLANASKYSEAGSTIWFEIRREDDQAVIEIRDEGIGIASEDFGRIFTPFLRGDSDRVRLREGHGVGLAMVHRIIARHGGSISASSAGTDEGSIFTLRLPVASVGDSAPAWRPARPVEQEQEPWPARPAHSARSVLIVEDDEAAAEGLAMVLRLWGCVVRVAIDGDEGFRLALADPPALLVIDRALPGLDGDRLARLLRESPAMAATTFISLSGDGRPHDDPADSPFDHSLRKPIDFEELVRLIPYSGIAIP